jgi:hypothetical protein
LAAALGGLGVLPGTGVGVGAGVGVILPAIVLEERIEPLVGLPLKAGAVWSTAIPLRPRRPPSETILNQKPNENSRRRDGLGGVGSSFTCRIIVPDVA